MHSLMERQTPLERKAPDMVTITDITMVMATTVITMVFTLAVLAMVVITATMDKVKDRKVLVIRGMCKTMVCLKENIL